MTDHLSKFITIGAWEGKVSNMLNSSILPKLFI